MDNSYSNATPPLIQSDAIFSNILTTSKLNEFVGPTTFLGAVTMASTTSPVSIAGTLSVASLTVSGPTVLGTSSTSSILIGTTTSRVGFYGHSLVLQPTASVLASTLLTGTVSELVNSSTTFDGYTLSQFIAAVRSTGIIA